MRIHKICRAAITGSRHHKSFGDHAVLDGVDLTVPEGTVYALLGPNGAGKTTIVNILATLLTPTAARSGSPASTWTRDPTPVRAAIGVTGQFSAIDELLTGARTCG